LYRQNVQESVDEFSGDHSRHRKRQKKAQKENWQVNIQKKNRMQGKSYLGHQRIYNEERSSVSSVILSKTERKLGTQCTSHVCIRSKFRNCQQFTEYDRKREFERFWSDMDWGQKKSYVLSLVEQKPVKQRTSKSGGSRRSGTLLYYLKLDNTKLQVCKAMFLSSLGLTSNEVFGWIKRNEVNRKPRRIKQNPIITERSTVAAEFLQCLPKLPAHYCRHDSAKSYLEPIFTSKNQLYRAYEVYCQEKNHVAVSSWKFSNLIDVKKISLYQPKKDECDQCCAKEAGNLTNEEWNLHITKKNEAQEEENADKLNNSIHVVVMDVQAVKNVPCLNASALYYKMKLVMHNFTVYDLQTGDAKCYVWNESEGELVASVFASCLVAYLEEKFDDEKTIVVFSDGCTNQYRNAILSTALLDLSVRKKKVIIQKFLEKGHAQLEVDSVHSAIECNLKNKTMYAPEDFVKICVDARKHPKPYEVQYVKHTYFKDYSIGRMQRFSSIRPGTKSGDHVVTDIRQLKYSPNGSIEYKLDYKATSNWQALPRKGKKIPDFQVFPQLYSKPVGITKRKYQDLQDLLHVVPHEFHEFYNSLPVV